MYVSEFRNFCSILVPTNYFVENISHESSCTKMHLMVWRNSITKFAWNYFSSLEVVS